MNFKKKYNAAFYQTMHVGQYCVLFASVFSFDRFSKVWALHNCETPLKVNDFLSCAITFNRGVVWS